MKKFIAVLLAVLMTLSMGSVAFVAMAEGDEIPQDETSETAGGIDLSNISLEDLEDLPMWQVKGAAKIIKIIAKIALKIGMVLIKLGIIDVQDVVDFVTGLMNGADTPEEQTPVEDDVTPDVVPDAA
ncbi:MAG: hypothetical protein MJ177_10675 [Clostridia bacterium]|nr:hypothetical protein [Clostridia bacterium]